MQQAVIIAEQVEKVYRNGSIEVHALRGVNLQVVRAEMVAVMGPSGCGKTTLLNCLSGLDEPDAGRVIIEGSVLHEMSERARTEFRARRMGFVFQSFNLLPVLSAVENVELPLLVTGTRPTEARRRALEVLTQVGLADRARHRPAELSGGERQRVAIARALVNQPAIVWADEPTGNLDSETGAEVIGLMRRLNREHGQTFVIVTHNAHLAALCDRVLRMQDGRVIADGRLTEP